jgi:hypothetical protein
MQVSFKTTLQLTTTLSVTASAQTFCTLTVGDIRFPATCPVLEIPIFIGHRLERCITKQKSGGMRYRMPPLLADPANPDFDNYITSPKVPSLELTQVWWWAPLYSQPHHS